MMYLKAEAGSRQDFARKAGFASLILLYLVVFVSKAAINVAYGIMALFTIVYILKYIKWDFIKNRYLAVFLFPFGFGLVLSVFSSAGFEGPLNFIHQFRFMLLMIPLFLFVESRKDFNVLLGVMIISALVGTIYGVATGQGAVYGTFRGLHRVGRNADMLMVLSLALSVFLFKKRDADKRKEWVFKVLLCGLLALFIWGMGMSAIRGAWVGFFMGVSFFAVFFERKVLILIFAAMVMVICVKNADMIKKEIISIKDTKVNVSNVARLSLWKTGLEFSRDQFFFGTGSDNSKERFVEFFQSKPKEYQSKYHWAMVYAGNFHNSYLEILIENGLLVFLAYLCTLGYILVHVATKVKKVAESERKYIIAALTVSAGFLVTQFFHGELYSYGVITYYLVLFGAFLSCNGIKAQQATIA